MFCFVQDEVKVWRPPTPPRGAAINADQTPPSPKLSTISFPKTSVIAATPFSLESVVEESSPSPNIDVASTQNDVEMSSDATFCLSSQDVEDNSSHLSTTFSVSTRDVSNATPTFSVLSSVDEFSRPKPAELNSSVDNSVLSRHQQMLPTKPTALSYQQFVDIPKWTTGVTTPNLTSNNTSSSSNNVTPNYESSSMETSYVEESNNAFDATIVLGNPSSMLNSTVVLSKDDETENKRRTFLVPTINENKENVITTKASAPIAMVSPMTSHANIGQSVAGGIVKAKKSLKKAFHHPIASTSNLRAVLDLKPSGHKSRFVFFFLSSFQTFNFVRSIW